MTKPVTAASNPDAALTSHRAGEKFLIDAWVEPSDPGVKSIQHYYGGYKPTTEVEIASGPEWDAEHGWTYRVVEVGGRGMSQTVSEFDLYKPGYKDFKIGTILEFIWSNSEAGNPRNWTGAVFRHGTEPVEGDYMRSGRLDVRPVPQSPTERTTDWWVSARFGSRLCDDSNRGTQYWQPKPVLVLKVRPRPDYFEVGDVVRLNGNVRMMTSKIGTEVTVEQVDRDALGYPDNRRDRVWFRFDSRTGQRYFLASHKFDLVKRVDEVTEDKEEKVDKRRNHEFIVGDRVSWRSFGETVTGTVMRQRQYRTDGSHVVVARRDDGNVDRGLVGEERGGWAVRAASMTLVTPAFDETTAVEANEDNFQPGAVVKFTVKAERNGSRFNVGCKNSDANTLLSDVALLKWHVDSEEGHTLTFQATVQAGTYEPHVRIAGATATFGEIEDYATEFLVLSPGEKPDEDIDIVLKASQIKALYAVVNRTPFASLNDDAKRHLKDAVQNWLDLHRDLGEIISDNEL